MARRPHTELPFSRSVLRARLLKLAGISEVDMAQAAKLAFDVLRRNLSAKRVELVTYQGGYREVELPDLAVNQRAAEATFDLSGISLSRQDSGDGPGDVHITIEFPAACRPTNAIDITPAPALTVVADQEADQHDP